jgi:peptidoglycan/LPS O-acetylase OafA/YrhL
LKRIPQLDGLRAFAFLAVFLNHSIYVPMMWVGVDQFFALSGFLITSILLASRTQDRGEYFGTFYKRRAQRILPAYFLVLAAVALLIKVDIDWPSIWWHFLVFAQNFSVALQYKVGVLNPYWSLAVEEQYYMLWPLLVYFLSRRQLAAACILFIVAAPILRALITPHTNSYLVVFTLTPFRIDQLAVGSLLAVIWSTNRDRVEKMLPLATTVLAISGTVFFGLAVFPWWRAKANSMAFNVFGYSISSILFASILVVVLCSKNRLLQGVLTNKWLMRVGTVSYMAYLIHAPVLHFTLTAFGRWLGSAIGFVITLVISALSWRFIEKPILDFGRHRTGERPREMPIAAPEAAAVPPGV